MPVFVWGLVLGTSAAVAAVAWWLVPPYLALMAFLLLEPAGRRVSATNPAGPRSAMSGASASAVGPDPAESAGPSDSSASNDAAPAPKARRGGKGRGSRKARPAFEPAPAAWVQVAPGKFVRVEPGSPTGESGPYTTLPPGTPMSPPSAAEAEAVPGLDAPDRPAADTGPHDAPTEAALEHPHLETTPAEGPAPEGPRDPEPAVVGWSFADDARAESSAFGRDVMPDPGPRPSLGAPSVEAAEADPIRDPEVFATDDPDLAAGTQPEAAVDGPVVAWAQDVAADVEPPAVDESLVEPVDVADESADRPGDPSRGPLPDAIGASYPGRAMAAWSGGGVPPLRRDVRSTRSPHGPNGLRLCSRRGDGRPHHFVRAFPPRSPPRQGPIRA
ncbi:MAG TPA: hypothetical protein VGH33_07995 [Isosphaeraceae bacterium]